MERGESPIRFDINMCPIEHEHGNDVTPSMFGRPVESRVTMDEVFAVDEG